MEDNGMGKAGFYAAIVMLISVAVAVVGIFLGNFKLVIDWLCVAAISYYVVASNAEKVILYCEELSRRLEIKIRELERRKAK